MRAEFAPEIRRDPDGAHAETIARRCVHCGFCNATCPTYLLLGDERDSPRGRIYLIKRMLEAGGPADRDTVRHIDRCLSCYACMTTCPSGVDYMHLVDHARRHIERTYRRPLADRWLRAVLLRILPHPGRFRFVARIGSWFRPLARFLPSRIGALLALAPARVHPVSPGERPAIFPAEGVRHRRVALLAGCVQPVVAPEIHAATLRLLTRCGCEVVVAHGAGCCGALAHHFGAGDRAHAYAAANIRAWSDEIRGEGLDAILANTSGCGTSLKDYGHMFRSDPELAEDAARVSGLARDVSEFLTEIDLGPAAAPGPLRVAYHAACSLQHGQGVRDAPKELLARAGYEVVEPQESHICCGSAGLYNILQPEIAQRLQARKAGHLAALEADVIATGNVGCMMQIGAAMSVPVVHTVELLDWAAGGPRPPGLG